MGGVRNSMNLSIAKNEYHLKNAMPPSRFKLSPRGLPVDKSTHKPMPSKLPQNRSNESRS